MFETRNDIVKISKAKADPYTALFRAVLLQLLVDLKSNSKKKDNKQLKSDAEYFFKHCSKDLDVLCTLADLDKSFILKNIDGIINNK